MLNVLDSAEEAVEDGNVTEVHESLVNDDIDITQNEASSSDDTMHIRNDCANN